MSSIKKTNWHQNAVIYQIYPRSFLDTNNDGLGDIPGIIKKLDYLSSLGVNAIWLSPIYDSPQEDNGYDISNYLDIYPPFGTLNDVKTLINEMHKRGMKLMMDLVINHTSSEHYWFKDVISNPNSKYKDFYIIKKGKENGKKPPNNWSGFFGEKAWEKLPGSEDEYYLRLFAKGQPDLNWENPKLREEIKKMLRFWLDMGVDGFRCDVINLISKKQSFKSSFPSIALCGKENYINGPRLHEYLQELHRDVFSHYDCSLVGETVLTKLKDARELTSPERKELDMIFNFKHTDVDNYLGVKYFYRKFKLTRYKKALDTWQYGMNNKGWNTLFLENHDQRRSVGRFFSTEKEEYRLLSLKALAASYFLLKGTPFIYQGQEIGMSNAHFSSLKETRDVEISNIMKLLSKLPINKKKFMKVALDVSRDNARIPISWDNSKYGGFSKVEPWIRNNKDLDKVNVKKALEEKDSLFYWYQALIKFRLDNEVIIKGEYKDLYPHHKKLFIYERTLGDKKVTVVINCTDKNVKHSYLKQIKNKATALSNYESHEEYLLPYEVRILSE